MPKDLTWRHDFPGLTGLPVTVADLLDQRAVSAILKRGAVIFGPGNAVENLLLLVSGTVRVLQLSETGRKIVLYRVHGG